MFSSPFLPLPTGLKIATTTLRDDLLMVEARLDEIEIMLSTLFLPCRTSPQSLYSHGGRFALRGLPYTAYPARASILL